MGTFPSDNLPYGFTCPTPFLLVPDKRTIYNFDPCSCASVCLWFFECCLGCFKMHTHTDGTKNISSSTNVRGKDGLCADVKLHFDRINWIEQLLAGAKLSILPFDFSAPDWKSIHVIRNKLWLNRSPRYSSWNGPYKRTCGQSCFISGPLSGMLDHDSPGLHLVLPVWWIMPYRSKWLWPEGSSKEIHNYVQYCLEKYSVLPSGFMVQKKRRRLQ